MQMQFLLKVRPLSLQYFSLENLDQVDREHNERLLFKTSFTNAMSVKFHATGSRPDRGFVAEVVTLPISVVGVDRDIR